MLPTSFERSKLIAIIVPYFRQHDKLQKIESSIDIYNEFPSLNLFNFKIENIIDELMKEKKFDQVRAISEIDITNEEADHEIEKLRKW